MPKRLDRTMQPSEAVNESAYSLPRERQQTYRISAADATHEFLARDVIFREGETEMKITKYVRYSAAGKTSYGIFDDQIIRELHGDVFAGAEPTGRTIKFADVKLLPP